MYPDPDTFIDVIEKSQKFLNKLICDSFFQDLNFIGKLSFTGIYYTFTVLKISCTEVPRECGFGPKPFPESDSTKNLKFRDRKN